MKANLHIHTNCSDGAYSVRKTLSIMKKHGFSYLSITDHNTVAGLREGRKFCKENRLRFINGVEITAYVNPNIIPEIDETYNIHILGYGINESRMNTYFNNIEKKKQDKLVLLIDKLIEDGYKIDVENIIVDGKIRDRVVIADALLKAGYVKSIEEAFQSLLNGKYLEYSLFYGSAIDTVKAIRSANGIAVWAHPYFLKQSGNKTLTLTQIEKIISALRPYGLSGIESFYMQFNTESIENLSALANKYNLIETIGTDFHGPEKNGFSLLSDKRIPLYSSKINLPFFCGSDRNVFL